MSSDEAKKEEIARMKEEAAEMKEPDRASHLLDAQEKANKLFEDIASKLVRPGLTEKQLSDEIWDLGVQQHGIERQWHKNVVRSGPNTLKPYSEPLTDRVIQEDDIFFVDLGPIFEAWEADFGRTFVTGSDPHKLKLRDSLEPVWKTVKGRFDQNPDMSGEELYAIACEEAKKAGYEHGGVHAGHLVGHWPHERIGTGKVHLYITEGSKDTMNQTGKDGNKRHWILEIHLVDRERQIGGFMEQLLTLG
jgi:Xaa-Pro aminopeptidase